MIELRVNDVYSFHYKPEVEKSIREHCDPYHCFDGQLVVKLDRDGQFYLEDTYWTSNGKVFTLIEALDKGELKFKCNLNEVRQIEECQCSYYDNKDIFDLSSQHGYRKQWVVKKDAKRSKAKILETLQAKIAEAERQIESAQRRIRQAEENIALAEAGELDKIYF